MKDESRAVKSMLEKITKRMSDISSERPKFGAMTPIQVATETIWGLMFMGGTRSELSLPLARKSVVHEIRRRCDCSWAGATEAVTKAFSALNQYGYIVIENERAKPTEFPPFLPNLLSIIDRRWMEPHLHVVKAPKKFADFPRFNLSEPAKIWVTFKKTVKDSVAAEGVIDKVTFDRPLRYFIQSPSLSRMADCGEAMYQRLNRLRVALEKSPTEAFMFSNLSTLRLSGDPLAAVALGVVAWCGPPTESTVYTMFYDCDPIDFHAIEEAYAE